MSTPLRRPSRPRSARLPLTRPEWPTALMLALTFSTGVVDAVGYLGLDKVFTGNMTGNVVVLGMALGGADDLPVLGPVLALLGFATGAALSGRGLRSVTGAWTGRFSLVMAGVSVVLVALTVVVAVGSVQPSDTPGGLALVTTTALGLAMGAQAAAARTLGVRDVTTVVVTSTLTGLAADSRLGAHRPGGTARRLSAVVLVLLGALVGALLLQWHVAAGLACATLVVGTVTVVGARRAATGPLARLRA